MRPWIVIVIGLFCIFASGLLLAEVGIPTYSFVSVLWRFALLVGFLHWWQYLRLRPNREVLERLAEMKSEFPDAEVLRTQLDGLWMPAVEGFENVTTNTRRTGFMVLTDERLRLLEPNGSVIIDLPWSHVLDVRNGFLHIELELALPRGEEEWWIAPWVGGLHGRFSRWPMKRMLERIERRREVARLVPSRSSGTETGSGTD